MLHIGRSATKPELIVQHTVRSLGVGYRLNRQDLSATADLVFMGRKKLIFVHGCSGTSMAAR